MFRRRFNQLHCFNSNWRQKCPSLQKKLIRCRPKIGPKHFDKLKPKPGPTCSSGVVNRKINSSAVLRSRMRSWYALKEAVHPPIVVSRRATYPLGDSANHANCRKMSCNFRVLAVLPRLCDARSPLETTGCCGSVHALKQPCTLATSSFDVWSHSLSDLSGYRQHLCAIGNLQQIFQKITG